jgi:hypothetical protein
MRNIKIINEAIRLRKWLEKRKSIVERQRRDIDQRLAKKMDAGITAYSNGIGTWFANLGNEKVLSGNPAGWDDLRTCFDYYACGIRIITSFQDAGKYGWIAVMDVDTWLAFAIAFRIDSFANWLGERLLNSLKAKDGKFDLGPPSPFYRAFIPFYAVWKRIDFEINAITNDSLGIYQDVFDNWTHESGYLKAMQVACDYHVKQMHEEKGYSEFLGAPQDLLPVEILMIRRIREDHGLPNPEIDHPLMQTPLGKAPRTLPEVKDELLERVLAKAKKELPHFPTF